MELVEEPNCLLSDPNPQSILVLVSYHNLQEEPMKNLGVILAVVLLASRPSAAKDPTFAIGLHGGPAISAFEDLISDFYTIGFGGGAHVDVNIAPFFSLRLNGEYFTFPSDKDKLKAAIAPMFGLQASDISNADGGAINVVIVTLNALGKIPTNSAVTPYALFGLGIHTISLSDLTGSVMGQSGTVTADDLGFKEGTKFGLDFGFGLDFQASRSASISVEFKYVLVFTEDNSNGAMPITVGASFIL